MTEQEPNPPVTQGISRTRKILIVLFMIGFWIFYFWYKDEPPAPPPATTPQQSQSSTQ